MHQAADPNNEHSQAEGDKEQLSINKERGREDPECQAHWEGTQLSGSAVTGVGLMPPELQSFCFIVSG